MGAIGKTRHNAHKTQAWAGSGRAGWAGSQYPRSQNPINDFWRLLIGRCTNGGFCERGYWVLTARPAGSPTARPHLGFVGIMTRFANQAYERWAGMGFVDVSYKLWI